MSKIKLSIYTPTHKPDYIDELYDSLLEQKYVNWEWVILTNGKNSDKIYNKLKSKFKNDERIKIYKAIYNTTDSTVNIGDLKRQACEKTTGDYLVEVDHDDLLTPDAFEEIIKCITDENPDFIYSDFCEFYSDWSYRYYDKVYGWENYDFIYKDKTLKAMKSFDISPRSLYQIFYAPNHIRIWKKEFYLSIGGYDKALHVCDDHDLLCRTYINNGKMVKINKPIYLYRLLDNNNNSYILLNDDIQTKQQEIGNKYFYKLVNKWCDDNKLLKLDLGGAFNKPDGYTSLDLLDDADIVCDITEGIPLPDNSVGIVRAYDFLEHIPRLSYKLKEVQKFSGSYTELVKENDFVNLMNEIYRVLAPNGWLLTATPSCNTKAGWQDPTHVNPINTNTFWYFTNKEYSKYVPEISCRFQDTRIWETNVDSINNIGYTCADLLCLKGNKVAGKVKI